MAYTFEFEPSGTVKLPNDEELTRLDANSAIVMLTQGKMADGRSYYAYVAVKPSKYRMFQKLTSMKQPLVLSEFGEVIAAGFTYNPPPEVVEKMRMKYGCNPQFQNEMVSEAIRQQQVFLMKKEKERADEFVGILKRKQQDSVS